jgi:hypothetical protein
MASTPAFVATPKITPQSFVNADSTNKKTICTAGASGTKVVSVVATSTDTSDRTAQLWLTRSAVSYLLGTATVTTLAGTNGTTPAQNLLVPGLFPGLPVDNDGQRYFFLESGDTLQVGFTVAVTAAKEIDITVSSGNF